MFGWIFKQRIANIRPVKKNNGFVVVVVVNGEKITTKREQLNLMNISRTFAYPIRLFRNKVSKW